tara:strand:+ start:192 stop:1550 length:1359 start_codon:yes stop_codon:yes gene_type:complete
MSEGNLKDYRGLKVADQLPLSTSLEKNNSRKEKRKTSVKPTDQLKSGLLGWYATSRSSDLKEGRLNFFSMFNEPLVLYRDENSIARCIKDLCPHRGASFMESTKDGIPSAKMRGGEIVCPYHGARFSSQGDCTNIDRITCQHIVDSNYNNYAKKIHLYQYPCIEKNGYIYIYYTGKALNNLENFDIKNPLEDLLPETYGFDTSEYAYEEVCVDFKCDWARIVENHLDILHIFWVHGDTIPDKDVNRNVITSFDQKINKDENQIETIYLHKDKSKGEFIRIKFIPPGRILIYKGNLNSARYVQILDHIPLATNRARVIVRHYRKFMKNKLITKLFIFKSLQHRVFYKVFSEDYLILQTQTFNQQMGYIERDNVKLLGEDKMVQYYWDWFQNAIASDRPWDYHPLKSETNSVHMDRPMFYPPENPKLSDENSKNIILQLLIRALIPIGFIILII